MDPITAHTFFLGESGGNTAAQWRTFARHYAAFVLVELWTVNEATAKGKANRLDQEELEPLLLVAEITDLVMRYSISEKQIATLRTLIKRLQDISYRDRPTIYRCSNLHWLSHLPDDIEAHGPCPSWWLFGFERNNKILKGANTNGHASNTPLTAMNKFIYLALLERLGSYQPPEGDLGAAYLAARSAEAFRTAFGEVNMTEEEREARFWTQEREGSEPIPNGHNRLDETVMEVVTCRTDPMSLSDRTMVRTQWNSNPRARHKVRLRSESANPDNAELVLPTEVQCWTEFWIGRNFFSLPKRQAFPVANIAIPDLATYNGAFIEWRSDSDIFACVSRQVYLGIIEGIYQVEATNATAKESRRFMKLHLLMPYQGVDPYKFQQRM